MTDQSFTTTFLVDQTAQEVFDAINDVRGWWAQEIDGDTVHVGDEFTYRYGDVHRCRIRVTESVPGEKVSWLVLENHFNFTADSTEWTGDTIDFQIGDHHDGRVEVRFTHHGLVPSYECFDACYDGWTHYINGSLRDLITTGAGRPNGAEQPRTAEESMAARRSG